MIGALALAPTPGDVVLGILSVLAGGLVAAAAAHQARRAGNWLYHLGTVGGLLIVVGVAGQRAVVAGAPIGPWDAGIPLPLLGVRMTPVCAAGVILTLFGLTLVLLFERLPDGDAQRREPLHRPLEEDDSV